MKKSAVDESEINIITKIIVPAMLIARKMHFDYSFLVFKQEIEYLLCQWRNAIGKVLLNIINDCNTEELKMFSMDDLYQIESFFENYSYDMFMNTSPWLSKIGFLKLIN